MLGTDLYKIFISAHKYEKLTILRQFTPCFDGKIFDEETTSFIKDILHRHNENYGRNLIIQGNRIPKNDFEIIDRKLFDDYKIEYNNNELIKELFMCANFNLGYIGYESILENN